MNHITLVASLSRRFPGLILFFLLMVGPERASSQEKSEVFTREIPDMDLRFRGGEVLDLQRARPCSFDRSCWYDVVWASFLSAGDLAYGRSPARLVVLVIPAG